MVDKPVDLRASLSGDEAQGVEVFADVLSAPLYPGQLVGGAFVCRAFEWAAASEPARQGLTCCRTRCNVIAIT